MANTRSNRRKKKGKAANDKMLFGPLNYKLLVGGLVLIFVGFLVMALEGKVKGFISLYISPFLILAGFAEIVFAIMRPRSGEKDQSKTVTHSS